MIVSNAIEGVKLVNGSAMFKLAHVAILNPIIKPWPFQGRVLDFIGQIYPSLSKGHWFVLVAMYYFTK